MTCVYDKNPHPNKKISKSALKRKKNDKKRDKKKRRKIIKQIIENDFKIYWEYNYKGRI